MWNSRSNSFTTNICPHTQIQQRHVTGADCITRLHTRSENYTVCFMQVPLQPPQCSCHMVLATHIRNTENWACVRTYIRTDCIPNLWMYTYKLTAVDSRSVTHTHLFIYLQPLSPLFPPPPPPPPSYTHSPSSVTPTHSLSSHTHSPLPVTPTHPSQSHPLTSSKSLHSLTLIAPRPGTAPQLSLLPKVSYMDMRFMVPLEGCPLLLYGREDFWSWA